MRKMLQKNEKGFTLIELLVVIAIIGILAAVAIPQFAEYRKGAYCGRVESDVSNVMLAEEAFFAQNDQYTQDLGVLGIEPDADVSIAVTSVDPLTVTGDDATGNCELGTFTAEAGKAPAWSAP